MNPALSTPSTPAPPAPPAPRRRRRWLRLILVCILLALLTGLGLIGFTYYSARSAWIEAEAEASRDLPRWQLAELESDRPAIPDEENAALSINAIQRKGAGVSVGGVPRYDKLFEKLPPTAQLNTQQIQLIRTQLAKVAKPLEEARLLKDKSRGRFPIKFSDDYIATLIPDHQNARQIAEWLQHDAWLLAQDEHGDLAVESCQAILSTSRVYDGDPFLIPHLIRLAMQNISLNSLERVLAQGEPSEAVLQTMQAMIERDMKENGLLAAVRGERAGYHHLFDNIRTGKVQWAWLRKGLGVNVGGGSFADPVTEWIVDTFPGVLLKYYPDYLQSMNRCVAATKLPMHERLVKLKEWEEEIKQTKNPVVRMLTPALTKVNQADVRTHALLRCAAAALACERYRREFQEWPATLDVLVQKKLLAAVPLDPFDNQPLRYLPMPTKDGIVIYSIGFDGIDNRGHIDRDNPYQPGVDIGFRLWDVPRRRQAPLPPIGIPENELAP